MSFVRDLTSNSALVGLVFLVVLTLVLDWPVFLLFLGIVAYIVFGAAGRGNRIFGKFRMGKK